MENNNNVKQIPSGNYEGYIWMSDKSEPRVITGEFEGIELKDGENPFVVEANLYDRTNKKSYSVKYVDGHYIAKCFEIENDGVDVETYVGNRMKGNTLSFKQVWRPVKDDFCEDMEVLKPQEIVFVGFGKEERK